MKKYYWEEGSRQTLAQLIGSQFEDGGSYYPETSGVIELDGAFFGEDEDTVFTIEFDEDTSINKIARAMAVLTTRDENNPMIYHDIEFLGSGGHDVFDLVYMFSDGSYLGFVDGAWGDDKSWVIRDISFPNEF